MRVDKESEDEKEKERIATEICKDMSNLLKGIRFEEYLHFKALSDKKHKCRSNNQQVFQVNKSKKMKKGSLCWLLEEKGGRTSTNCARRKRPLIKI